MLCCNHSWLSTNTIPLLALIVSVLTLCLGYKAYKRFLLQQLKQKQLDIVLELVAKINKDRNEYVSISGAVFPFERKSIFDITTIDTFNAHDKLYFVKVGVVQDRTDSILNWDFVLQYYKNPLLPSGIAQKLRFFVFPENSSFKPIPIQQILNYSFDDRKILVGNRRFDEVITVICYNGTPIEYADTFQKCANDLKKEIIGWLKNHGIEDINLFEEDESLLIKRQ